MTRDSYISEYKDLAVDTTAGTGLFPSVMLAQAIVESSNGNSELSSKYNNHFGIKAQKGDGWTGKKVNLSTREVVKGSDVIDTGSYFRVYSNAKDSYKDRVKFLTENPRYRAAGVFDAKTPMEQLQALQRAGYATDPKYAEIINSIVVSRNLSVLDRAIAFSKRNWVAITLTSASLIAITVLLFMNKNKIQKL